MAGGDAHYGWEEIIMSSHDVSRGIEDYVSGLLEDVILWVQILIIGAVAGLYFWSWWVFFGVLIAMGTCTFIECLAIPTAILIALCSGAAAYIVVEFFDGGMLARIIGGLLVFAALAGVNCSSVKRELQKNAN